MEYRKKKLIIIFSSFIVLILTILISLMMGRYSLSFGDGFAILKCLLTGESISNNEELYNAFTIFFDIRLPRILAAVLIGGALAASGVMLQSIFANPLVSPGIMGVLSGASFGAALGIVIFSSWVLVQISSFVFGMASLLFALFIAGIYRSVSPLLLVLGGMISTALFNALLSIVKMVADPNDELASIVFWLMGSLSLVDTGNTLYTAGIPLFVVMIASILLGGVLNLLAMGDEEAKSLGINASAYRVFVIIVSGFLASMTIVIAGNIGWVGLIIPHISRMIIGPDNRYLLPLSIIIGGIFLLVADTIVRTLFPVDIPLGIVTSIVGIIVFIVVLKNNRKGWKA